MKLFHRDKGFPVTFRYTEQTIPLVWSSRVAKKADKLKVAKIRTLDTSEWRPLIIGYGAEEVPRMIVVEMDGITLTLKGLWRPSQALSVADVNDPDSPISIEQDDEKYIKPAFSNRKLTGKQCNENSKNLDTYDQTTF